MSYLRITHTVNDVAKHVKRQFGDESSVQITDEDIIRWVNAGQEEIFRRSEPIKATSTANVVAGQHTYTFPDNILKIQSILVSGKPVPHVSTQEAEEHILTNDPKRTSTGTPELWYEWGGDFTFWPTPDVSSTGGIVLKYVKAPDNLTALTSLLSIPDTYYNRLLEYVLSQAYELDEDWGAADTKTTQFSTNLDAQSSADSVSANTYPRITVLEEDL